ncbi:uncharacterized protein N7483_001774 [Penicillium malachiteum]|uniref:uncharacterized protein n=1 Tax=Penicillium malachiteum TaxID=1324776 RepID=UPI0025492D5A|nr:uncharacterized protein N7483_001774 [Penicillium malachiteum]KAJ5736649.1 hypothetical protein N7483_001774 [Penicillium malachiteum]
METTHELSYLLHPSIPIKDDMAIADIGAGTGLWAIEVAVQLPSAQIIAYDISDTHFPLPEYRAPNVTFNHLDFLGDIPSSLVGQFDVVHLRTWAFIIRDNDPSYLIQNASKLLKPDGYIQWEDARFDNAVVKGDAALQLRRMMRQMSDATNLNFQWVDQLDQHINREAYLEVVECQYKPWSSQLIPLCMNTFFVALENTAALLDRLKLVQPPVPSSDDWIKALENVQKESRNGEQLYWLPVTLLARKDA